MFTLMRCVTSLRQHRSQAQTPRLILVDRLVPRLGGARRRGPAGVSARGHAVQPRSGREAEDVRQDREPLEVGIERIEQRLRATRSVERSDGVLVGEDAAKGVRLRRQWPRPESRCMGRREGEPRAGRAMRDVPSASASGPSSRQR